MPATGAGCVSGGVSWMVWLFMSHTVRPFFFVSECLPVFLGALNCDTVARSTASLNSIVLLATLNTWLTPKSGTPPERVLGCPLHSSAVVVAARYDLDMSRDFKIIVGVIALIIIFVIMGSQGLGSFILPMLAMWIMVGLSLGTFVKYPPK